MDNVMSLINVLIYNVQNPNLCSADSVCVVTLNDVITHDNGNQSVVTAGYSQLPFSCQTGQGTTKEGMKIEYFSVCVSPNFFDR